MAPTKADRVEELEREMAIKQAYDKQMEQRMMNAAQGMMNANMGMGVGLGSAGQNAAQNSLWGNSVSGATITANTIHPGPLVSKQSLQKLKRNKVRMDVTIEQAANGYVVTFGGGYEADDSHIAATFEDINTIINSELASRLLDKAE